MPNDLALFPSSETIETEEHRLTEKLHLARSRAASRKVTPPDPSEAWRRELAAFDFTTTGSLDRVTDWALDALEDGIVQMTHPGYLGLFNPAPSFPAEQADRIANAFNPQVCVWSHAPKAVEIEQHVIGQIARRAGLDAGAGGHFTSGGAEANAASLLCALTVKEPDFAERGALAFQGAPTLYASRESHLAWLKIAHCAGIGRAAVRLIDTDGSGRMSAAALETAIQTDLDRGCVPTLVVATAGTTNAGMIDPLTECRALANRHGMWLHVDAAWGGGLIASPDLAAPLRGIETADSITIDAHKWFATTMGAGMFLTPRADVLANVFRVSASYMPESTPAMDFYVNSAQWSRRFVGLRLFLSLATAGWDGHARHVANSIALIDRLCAGAEAAGWRRANASPMAVACLVPPEGHEAVDRHVERVLSSGRFWISRAIFEGRPVLRACVTNGRTSAEDIDALIALLCQPF